jgi:predicted ATP-grasp superfamily ATP-dependent carboligase
MTVTDDLLILGASARAAAFSALRAGLEPRCVDYFADRDLRAVCPVVRVGLGEGVAGLARVARGLPGMLWIYTGPLENHPGLVERLSRTHRLAGNPAEPLRAVRDPLRLAEILRRRGLPHAEVRLDHEGLPRAGSWLVKPLASGGGRLIRFLDRQPLELSEPSYFQQWIDGPSFSALFMACQGRARLAGVTRQLIGAPRSPFVYQGSIGPWPVSERLWLALDALGATLVSAFDLVGLFGVDYILCDEEPWPVEVNPRYTASVEILELALGRSLLAEHLRACMPGLAEQAAWPDARTDGSIPQVVGKAILYSRRSFVVPDISTDDAWQRDLFAVPAIADIPWPAQAHASEPIMTVFATGPDIETCESRLARLQERWRRRFGQ